MPFVQVETVTGLATTTINIPTTDIYNLQATLQLPTQSGSATQGPGGGAGTGTGAAPQVASQVVATVQHNSSTVLTTIAGSRGFGINTISCTAGDTLTIALSSSLAADQQPQAVQMTVAVSEGAL
jgi:hypothetical protein